MIRGFCKKYTLLTEDDIKKIIEVSKSMQYISELNNCDAFIDVQTRYEGEALVVYETKPSSGNSIYKGSVIGQMALRENEPAVLRTLELGVPTKELKGKTQEQVYVKQTTIPIKNKGKTIGVIILEMDISTEVEAQKAVSKMAKNYKCLSNTFDALVSKQDTFGNELESAILGFDNEGYLVIKNSKASELYKILGYLDDIENLHYDNLVLDNLNFKVVIEELIVEDVKTKEIYVGGRHLKIKNLLFNEKNLKLMVIINDITDILAKEAEIVSKQVAIREIHHRVKNNLQTIASLLRLQGRRCVSEEAKLCLMESEGRILSIAATHELLSQRVEDDISISEVLNSIKKNVIRCYTNTTAKVDIRISIEDFKIDSDRATSMALIVNELIQNSMDHAFKGKDSGTIDIILQGKEAHKTLIVKDDGNGFKDALQKDSGLGLNIVKSYVKDKLKGNISISSNSRGTKTVINFKI